MPKGWLYNRKGMAAVGRQISETRFGRKLACRLSDRVLALSNRCPEDCSCARKGANDQLAPPQYSIIFPVVGLLSINLGNNSGSCCRRNIVNFVSRDRNSSKPFTIHQPHFDVSLAGHRQEREPGVVNEVKQGKTWSI